MTTSATQGQANYDAEQAGASVRYGTGSNPSYSSGSSGTATSAADYAAIAAQTGINAGKAYNPGPITPGSLAPVSPLVVPPATSNVPNTLGQTANSYMTPPPNTSVDENGYASHNQPQNTTDQTRNSLMSSLVGENDFLGTKGEVTNELNSVYGVDQKQQDAIDSYNAYNSKKVQYGQQEAGIYDQPGITREQATQNVGELSRIHNADLANLAIISTAAQGNLTAAMDIVQRKLSAEFDPIQAQIDNQVKFLQLNNADLSDSEKTELEGSIAQNKQDAQNLYDAKLVAHQAAIQNGAPVSTLNAIDAAKDVQSTLQALGSYGKVNDFSLTTDPSTGQPILFNSKTGEVQGVGQSSSDSYTPPNPSKVVQTPSGNSYDLTTYATDPSYGQKINNTISQIGTITSAKDAQTAISKIAPNSPLTGQMIISAANSAGIDPTLLVAQVALESTASTTPVAINNNNTGGIKYAGQKGATQGTKAPDGGYYAKFNTLQDSLNAQAGELAKRKVDQSQSITVTSQPATTDTTGLDSKIQSIQTIKTNAPPTISGAITWVPSTGDGYLDLSKIPTGSEILARNYAKQNNIPILTASQVSDVNDAGKALSQLDNIQQAFTAIAPTSLVGEMGSQYSNTINKSLQTKTGQALSAYENSIIPSALSVFGAITGTSRVGQITTGLSEKSLPVFGKRGFLLTNFGAKAGDTLQTGIAKLNTIRQSLNSVIQQYIPNSTGSPTTSSSGGTVRMTGPAGTFDVPSGQVALFKQNGYQ